MILHFTFWYEQIKNKGEDALPLFLEINPNQYWLGVFDGMGGSGATHYTYYKEDKIITQTGAYWAALQTRELTNFFLQNNKNIHELEYFLRKKLTIFYEQLEKKQSILKNKFHKKLPTTICLASIEIKENQTTSIQTYHAGDSRAYLWNIEGCFLLTKDHIVDNLDAYQALIQDTKIINCVEIEQDFYIQCNSFSQEKPFILLLTTDGSFDYLQSPMHFEYLFLRTLINAQQDMEHWKKQFSEEIIKIASDDISLVLVAVGFKDFIHLQNYFYARYQYLYQHFIEKYEKENQSLEMLWKNYKNQFYSLLN
jgi:serine/threonine protein phosphatase PrpC